MKIGDTLVSSFRTFITPAEVIMKRFTMSILLLLAILGTNAFAASASNFIGRPLSSTTQGIHKSIEPGKYLQNGIYSIKMLDGGKWVGGTQQRFEMKFKLSINGNGYLLKRLDCSDPPTALTVSGNSLSGGSYNLVFNGPAVAVVQKESKPPLPSQKMHVIEEAGPLADNCERMKSNWFVEAKTYCSPYNVNLAFTNLSCSQRSAADVPFRSVSGIFICIQ